MKAIRLVLILAVIASLGSITAVSWHSVEEIHYLKSFYPTHFTVGEACQAALVELVKVHLISLPLVIVIAIAVYLLRPGKAGE